MPSGKRLLGGTAAMAALGVRLRRALSGGRRGAPEPAPAPEAPPAATSPPPPYIDVDEPPELPAEEVRELREDLRRELDRLADADIKASRSRPERASPPG